jgi:hypothetical protein
MGLHEVSVFDAEDLLTYAEVVDRPNSNKWLDAMRSEIQSFLPLKNRKDKAAE